MSSPDTPCQGVLALLQEKWLHKCSRPEPPPFLHALKTCCIMTKHQHKTSSLAREGQLKQFGFEQLSWATLKF